MEVVGRCSKRKWGDEVKVVGRYSKRKWGDEVEVLRV